MGSIIIPVLQKEKKTWGTQTIYLLEGLGLSSFLSDTEVTALRRAAGAALAWACHSSPFSARNTGQDHTIQLCKMVKKPWKVELILQCNSRMGFNSKNLYCSQLLSTAVVVLPANMINYHILVNIYRCCHIMYIWLFLPPQPQSIWGIKAVAFLQSKCHQSYKYQICVEFLSQKRFTFITWHVPPLCPFSQGHHFCGNINKWQIAFV